MLMSPLPRGNYSERERDCPLLFHFENNTLNLEALASMKYLGTLESSFTCNWSCEGNSESKNALLMPAE